MNKILVIFLKYHTVEEGKNMDREKLNMIIDDVCFKTTKWENRIIVAICLIVLGYIFWHIMRI